MLPSIKKNASPGSLPGEAFFFVTACKEASLNILYKSMVVYNVFSDDFFLLSREVEQCSVIGENFLG